MAADAEGPPLATVHHRRELRVLRVVGLAVRLPARRLHAVEPGARRTNPPRNRPVPAKALLWLALAGNLGGARLFQVLRLLRRLERQPPLGRRPRCPRRPSFDHSPGRHLVLHLHGDQLRRRHLSRRDRADDAREVRGLPLLLPAPRRRADRAARRAAPAAGDSPRPPPGRHEPRVLSHRDRSVQEGRDRQLPRGEHRRRGVRRAGPALVARDPDRDLRVRGPDLRRLLRLHRHRDRHRAPARVHASRRTSTRPTPRARCRISGAAGT